MLKFPKIKRIKDQKYLDWIETLGCVVCGRRAAGWKQGKSDAHHIPKEGHSTMAGKCDDNRAIPLCFRHHQEYHSSHGRLTFARYYDLDYEEIIETLNKIYKEVMKID